jgi:hypothetical protein
MLATFGGILALVLGLALLLLPLLATELSRPRDSAWGAVVLLLGLVLVTCADRLTGAPMLAVLSAGLLIGRLSTEVGQARWRQLSPEEQQRLWSAERWTTSLAQLAASLGRMGQMGLNLTAGLGGWIADRRRPKSSGKRWVRPDALPEGRTDGAEAAEGGTAVEPTRAAAREPEPQPESEPGPEPKEWAERNEAVVVGGFEAIDALLAAAPPAVPPGAETGGSENGEPETPRAETPGAEAVEGAVAAAGIPPVEPSGHDEAG